MDAEVRNLAARFSMECERVHAVEPPSQDNRYLVRVVRRTVAISIRWVKFRVSGPKANRRRMDESGL